MAPAKGAVNTADLSFTVAQDLSLHPLEPRATRVCLPSYRRQLRYKCSYPVRNPRMPLRHTFRFDKDKVAREFSNAKHDSFKRQIWVIGKMIKDAMENGVTAGGDGAAPVKDEVKGRERKAEEVGGASEKKKKKKKKKGREVEAEKVTVKSEGECEDGEEEMV
ncbi:hypothetical protein DOTSEDRAFT_24149 [Dothistroma septosporum NZE10]|uniref:Uncharacterized protein n=1 Tax=Dothistroma septosporum (strain NZE10 / CBS 128990) TaxID=675120 RepID=N1PL33_DOTSN|nr:hypothetical protein DOTSEDRAFT_24149 [Dothistroma septosporum NZE10]